MEPGLGPRAVKLQPPPPPQQSPEQPAASPLRRPRRGISSRRSGQPAVGTFEPSKTRIRECTVRARPARLPNLADFETIKTKSAAADTRTGGTSMVC